MALITCKECKNQVSDTAKKCPSCGAKVPEKTSIITWIGAGFFALVIWGAMSGPSQNGGASNMASSSSAQPEEIVEVKGSEIAAHYDQNEARADAIFKGRKIKITGLVTAIDKDFADNIVVMLKGLNEFQSVHAEVMPSEAQKAFNLQKGKIVVMQCIGKGEVVGSPMLDECIIL